MLKTAADFQQLAQEHPFCTGFLLMADQKGLSEEEIQTGLVKAASVHPARQAELERFVAATGQPLTMVKEAKGGFGGKVRQMRERTGQAVQSAHNWAREHPKTVGGAGLGLTGGLGWTIGKGIADYDIFGAKGSPATAPEPGQTADTSAATPAVDASDYTDQSLEKHIRFNPGQRPGGYQFTIKSPVRNVPATLAGPHVFSQLAEGYRDPPDLLRDMRAGYHNGRNRMYPPDAPKIPEPVTATHGPGGDPQLTVPDLPGSVAGPQSYGKGAPAIKTPVVAPKATTAPPAGTGATTPTTPPPVTGGSPSWYTNPALLGGGGLLALALAARAMQSGDEEEDSDEGY